MGDLVLGPFRGGETFEYMLIGTITLGFLGFRVQWVRFKSEKKDEEEQSLQEHES